MTSTVNNEMVVPWTFDDDSGGVDVKLVCTYDYTEGLSGAVEGGQQIEPDEPHFVWVKSIMLDGVEQIGEIPQAALDHVEKQILIKH